MASTLAGRRWTSRVVRSALLLLLGSLLLRSQDSVTWSFAGTFAPRGLHETRTPMAAEPAEAVEPTPEADAEQPSFPAAVVAAAVVQGEAEEAKKLVKMGASLEDRGARGMTALAFAAKKGDMDLVKFLVKNGADIEARDSAGRTVLSMAVLSDEGAEVTEYLIKKGAEVEAKDSGGLTALLWASLQGNAEDVKVLVNAGADWKVTDNDGMTAVKLATVFDKVDVVKLLVEQGADTSEAVKLGQRLGRSPKVLAFLSEDA
mmetsp:Transcript_11719/g.26148  ORF Transcript_11719/g.26148 Transcript_11719/m.26148 type:complete len:260 (+) Transcript_11719:83-862(+)